MWERKYFSPNLMQLLMRESMRKESAAERVPKVLGGQSYMVVLANFYYTKKQSQLSEPEMGAIIQRFIYMNIGGALREDGTLVPGAIMYLPKELNGKKLLK